MDCCFCGNSAIYSCVPCKTHFCEKHLRKHEKSNQHSFETLGTVIPSELAANIAENLSTKIRTTKDCSTEIIAQTKVFISQIKVQALTKMYTKKQEYLKLLILLQHNKI
jgi:hypothetical protein